ncbi:MAG: glutamate--tRNA ligase [Deltaproteobacteria bacterium]|nr:glutamate--tRNA ligase [Deltaproteobacteria bacterium]
MEENLVNGIRVRFAPSPTGNLHLGGVRTALFNYIFALKYSGKFILRIDDTDRVRSKKEYEDVIKDDLRWFEIKWDEFYRQSERAFIYEKYLNTLKENGLAYECFCTEEEILKSKEIAIKSKKPYIYNGRCANLSSGEKEKLSFSLKEKGLYSSIRLNIAQVLRMDPSFYSIEFNDAVHGHLSFNSKLIGDFILKTEDNRFAYNFASIIDDYDLGITHVIRGEDHISNTPKQILILKALGKEPPVFAHISLLYGKDGKIMSKRDAASNIKYYKEEGYLPEAVLNYLAVTGNTFTVHSSKDGKKEIFEKEIFSNILEMADLLDIKKAKGSSAVLNEDKLRHINEKRLALMPAEQLIKVLTEKFQAASILAKLKEEYGEDFSFEIIDFLKNEFKTVKEILKELEIFFDDFKINLSGIKYDDGLRKALLDSFQNINDFNENSIKNIIKEAASQNSKTVKECYETLRLFITGRLDGPSILKIIKFLGKNRAVKRLSI